MIEVNSENKMDSREKSVEDSTLRRDNLVERLREQAAHCWKDFISSVDFERLREDLFAAVNQIRELQQKLKQQTKLRDHLLGEINSLANGLRRVGAEMSDWRFVERMTADGSAGVDELLVLKARLKQQFNRVFRILPQASVNPEESGPSTWIGIKIKAHDYKTKE